METKHPGGRPTAYTSDLAKKMCDQISRDHRSIKQLAEELDWFPATSTFFEWLAKYKELADLYARAKDAQVEVRQEQIIDLVNDSTGDYVVDEKTGRHITNTVKATRLRLHVEYLKWAAERLKSKKYGSKTHTEITLDDSAIKHVKDRLDDIEKK